MTPTVARLEVSAYEALQAGDLLSSEQAYRQALALDPQAAWLWGNLLYVLWLSGRPQQGIEAFAQARRHLPEAELPWRNLGNLERDRNGFEAAERAYAHAMDFETDRECADTAWNRAQVLIGLERYREAYALAEGRFAIERHSVWRDPPHWRGWDRRDAADLAGLQVCVWTEQGFGDTFQYLRWIPELVRRGARVRLEVEPALHTLMRQGLSWLNGALTVAPKGCLPREDGPACQGSLLSLPHRLGGAPLAGDLRAGRGYLRSSLWTPPPPAPSRRPRVGLVWASGRKRDDAFVILDHQRRSLPAQDLHTLLDGLQALGADLVNLQFGPDRDRAEGWTGRFLSSLPPQATFAEAAAWIARLDLVISVDTATAHQVGAMGAPGWVLLPWSADPRWLRNRDDSPWYPTLSLLRQPSRGDWPGLVTLVLERFRRWQAERSGH